jgi:hypothetical protein
MDPGPISFTLLLLFTFTHTIYYRAPMQAHPPHEHAHDVAVMCAVRTFSNKNQVKKINTAGVMLNSA